MLRILAVALIGFALLAGCADEDLGSPHSYVVQPNDTLYSIAWRNGLDYRDLAAWNHIGPDFRIAVGERLTLAPPAGGYVAAARPAPRRVAPPLRRAPAPPEVRAAPVRGWQWPTLRIGPIRRLPNGAVLLPGRLDQPVRAAAAGKVVYTGSGIRGFGELVIIKHSATLLSAYAYNAGVVVHDGDQVAAGQVIARMGEGEGHAPMLYFEIRANGRTVDPLPYLGGAR